MDGGVEVVGGWMGGMGVVGGRQGGGWVHGGKRGGVRGCEGEGEWGTRVKWINREEGEKEEWK